VVFLDPPFNKDLLKPACDLLEQRGWLADDAWVYTESETARRPWACRATGACTASKKPEA
jgi:16S rRNA G966 N2-methylase RsmD